MAELSSALPTLRGARLAWSQFGAIAWLRWRIFLNGARRKGGKGELIARILLYPLALGLVFGPAVLAGFFAWFLAMHGSLQYLNLLFWAAFGLTQLLNINLSQPGTTFDPVELIRFPMALRNYILVRLCFGLLSPANAVITMMSLAIFIGFTIDRPHAWLGTLAAAAVFALANVLFSRMIFAWIDRWLSTRRAREIFTALIFAASLIFQYINVTYNPGLNHSRHRQITPQKLHNAQLFVQHVHPWLAWLPPELTADSLISSVQRRSGQALQDDALVALYAAAFLAVYALRMRSEYHGENLSDQANAVRTPSPLAGPVHALTPAASLAFAPPSDAAPGLIPQTLVPLLSKELLLLRRNTGLLYGVIAPVVMVFLFAGRLSLRGGSHWLLLIAVAYAMLGLAPQSYNSFGLEGAGAQFYFMAPVPLREVFFAKNAMHFVIASFEVLAVDCDRRERRRPTEPARCGLRPALGCRHPAAEHQPGQSALHLCSQEGQSRAHHQPVAIAGQCLDVDGDPSWDGSHRVRSPGSRRLPAPALAQSWSDCRVRPRRPVCLSARLAGYRSVRDGAPRLPV